MGGRLHTTRLEGFGRARHLAKRCGLSYCWVATQLSGRLFSDIDIMVKHEHLQAVEVALFRHGWISEERDAYNNRYYQGNGCMKFPQ